MNDKPKSKKTTVKKVNASTPTTKKKNMGSKNRVINLRVSSRCLEVIEKAAQLHSNTDRTKYILDAAYKAAESDLFDRRNFMLSDAEFSSLEAILNAPPRDLPKLRALLQERAPWEK